MAYGVRVGTAVSQSSIFIPSTYNEIAITEILEYGFEDCINLTAITLPNSITTIGDYAFNNCTLLNKITFPNNLESIGRFAFYNCNAISTIKVPANVNYIGAFAFYKTSLTEANFEVTTNWTAGEDGFDYFYVHNTQGAVNGSYGLSAKSIAAALTSPVDVTYYKSTSGSGTTRTIQKHWYTQDWYRVE